MQSPSNVGFQESYNNPPWPPTCPSLPLLPFTASFPCMVLWLGARWGARQDKPPRGPRREQADQTQTAKAQLQFLFPVEKEPAKVTWFFF